MKKCKYCDEEFKPASGLGDSCRVCKNGLYRYDMTRLDMIALHEAQNKICLLCNAELVMFNGSAGGNIDHCHTTGKVRGILCSRCNTTIGGIEAHLEIHEDISRLLEYINN